MPAGPGEATRVLDRGDQSGLSWLTHWEHSFSLASRTAVQFYYQREQRDDLFSRYRLDTVDFEFRHDIAITDAHAITWGLGHRTMLDDFDPAPLFASNAASPAKRACRYSASASCSLPASAKSAAPGSVPSSPRSTLSGAARPFSG